MGHIQFQELNATLCPKVGNQPMALCQGKKDFFLLNTSCVTILIYFMKQYLIAELQEWFYFPSPPNFKGIILKIKQLQFTPEIKRDEKKVNWTED